MPRVKIYRPRTWMAWRTGCWRTASRHPYWRLENDLIHHIPGHDFDQIWFFDFEGYFYFSNLFNSYFKQVKFWNICNRKGCPCKPTQVYFLVIRKTKKKEKGVQGFAKRLYNTEWATVLSTIFSTPPFGNWMGKGVIYFSPVKLLPAPEIYTRGEHETA